MAAIAGYNATACIHFWGLCLHTSVTSRWPGVFCIPHSPLMMILFYPLHFLGIALLKIMVVCFRRPRQVLILLTVAVLAFNLFTTIDNIIAWDWFLVMIINLRELVKDIMKDTGQFILATTGFCSAVLQSCSPRTFHQLPMDTSHPFCLTHYILKGNLFQLSNALYFMNAELGNHTKISSQVQNLAEIHSLFTDQIEMLDSMGVYTIKLVLYKCQFLLLQYFKSVHRASYSKDNSVESLHKLSRKELSKLQENFNAFFTKKSLFSKMEATINGAKATVAFLNKNKNNLKHGWFGLERQRRHPVLFREKIQQMKVHNICIIGNLVVPSGADYL
ncbi:hypothetical protein VP01_148g26 [Puccinia sorghi]|uniref:Uncharacterized protein n=1 Tax=Puccinia sorghi TaxID=27349 RepID=A0A0L6VJK9_9BASI|nr:hypothetical protein VP01_148g26 [Puccinia sorghi]